MLLFRQGLRQNPDASTLLRGLGLAAVHAGYADEALAPLEAAAREDTDAEVHVLLAHLYDRRDDSGRALEHLRLVLAQQPEHAAARRLLAKIEREARAEAGLAREITPWISSWTVLLSELAFSARPTTESHPGADGSARVDS